MNDEPKSVITSLAFALARLRWRVIVACAAFRRHPFSLRRARAFYHGATGRSSFLLLALLLSGCTTADLLGVDPEDALARLVTVAEDRAEERALYEDQVLRLGELLVCYRPTVGAVDRRYAGGAADAHGAYCAAVGALR